MTLTRGLAKEENDVDGDGGKRTGRVDEWKRYLVILRWEMRG
jgi:hypothetical protein